MKVSLTMNQNLEAIKEESCYINYINLKIFTWRNSNISNGILSSWNQLSCKQLVQFFFKTKATVLNAWHGKVVYEEL